MVDRSTDCPKAENQLKRTFDVHVHISVHTQSKQEVEKSFGVLLFMRAKASSLFACFRFL